jgi:3-oxoacyl-[acyl-carrier protein] reductase
MTGLAAQLSGPAGSRLLEGKVVVITAAAGTGIGGACTRRCLAEGAQVFISDIHQRRLEHTADELGVASMLCDVTRSGAIEELLDAAEDTYGPVDVLVNNAGLGGDARITDLTDSDWDRVLAVTLTSAFYGTRAALRRMIPRGRGSVVNMASITGWRAEPGQSHYAAAKAGVMALTRSAGVEAAAAGVRVNAVAPTVARHPYLDKVSSKDVIDEWVSHQPQGRAAEPGEIANVVAFLASDYASYLSGEVISVGGQHP